MVLLLTPKLSLRLSYLTHLPINLCRQLLCQKRDNHTQATLLPNGKVLIAGGYNNEYLATALLYDPQKNRFEPTGSMQSGRSGHVAVLLDNGMVLIAGGVGDGWTFLASAELYNPIAGTFLPVGDMAFPRESHTATVLQNGTVLITGGHSGRRANIVIYNQAEIFDPATAQFRMTGDLQISRHKHDALLLADGRVLVTGGADNRDGKGVYRSAELYDPVSGQFFIYR